MSKSVALIEFSPSHSECLYAQLLFLNKAGYTIHLIIPHGLRNEVETFGTVEHLFYIDPGRDFQGRWKSVFAVRQYLMENKITTAVFNTAEGNHVRDFCLTAPFGLNLAGTIHHTYKWRKSFTQKIISLRVHKYFVLNDYLLAGIPKRARFTAESYYPIFFPPVFNHTIKKPKGEIWVGIPGVVEFRRRDYRTFLEQLSKTKPDSALRFILLGKSAPSSSDGKQLRTMVQKANLARQFYFFNDFIANEIYFGYLRQCDVILPLIHPHTSLYDIYSRWQVSGAYNLSFGFGIPMLMHKSFEHISDFQISSYFYEIETLVETMNSLASNTHLLSAKASAIRSNPKFSIEYQSDKYIRFLNA